MEIIEQHISKERRQSHDTIMFDVHGIFGLFLFVMPFFHLC